MSMVFDARKRAEHSKLTRETTGTGKSVESAHSSDPNGLGPGVSRTSDANVRESEAARQAPVVRSLLRISRSQPRLAAPAANGNISPATVISREDPIYPAIAKQHLISGIVEVHFRIGPEGKVYDVRSVKGSPVLARAAVEAVEARCYEPARLNGEPIDSQAATNFEFKLS